MWGRKRDSVERRDGPTPVPDGGTGEDGDDHGESDRVLVTGATGTVGSEVLAGLAGTSLPVRAAARDAETARERLGHDVEYVDFDFEKPETYYPALEGVSRLFLVRPPAISRVSRSITPFLDAAERMGVEHVVVLSILGAENNPLLPHRRIEKHVLGQSVGYTFLRASFFMQNLLTEHREDILERDEVFVPAGDGKTSFVDARDIAAVAVAVLTDPAAHRDVAYDVTGPEALSYHEVATVMSEVLDRPITYPDPSLLAFARRMRSRGTPWPFVVVMAGIYTTARLGLAARVTDDVEKLLDRPPVDFRQFVVDYRDQFERPDARPAPPD